MQRIFQFINTVKFFGEFYFLSLFSVAFVVSLFTANKMCVNTEEIMNMDKHTISEFFAEKNVFITGATGFLGKALVEKLLRSCPKIRTLFLLVRPKHGVPLRERFNKLMDDPLFDRVKEEQSADIVLKKTHLIAGDMMQENMAISDEDQNLLIENVHVVFHVAATIRFNEPLEVAVKLNLRGTRDVCRLALKMKELKVFIHVSTAFSNCYQETTKEQLYPPIANWEEIIKMAETVDHDTLKELCPKLMHGMPNTYCFTKNLAEHCVNDLCYNKIPVLIFRPSVVTHMVTDDPIAGWADSFNGLTALIYGFSIGLIRTIQANMSTVLNQVPVDMVTKSLAVSAWDTASRGIKDNNCNIDIVHCTNDGIEWMRPSYLKIIDSIIEKCRDSPISKVIWTPNVQITKWTILYEIYMFLYVILPYYLFDKILVLSGRKPRLYKYVRKNRLLQESLHFFIINSFYFPNENFYKMRNRILDCDKKDWDYDFHDIMTSDDFLHLTVIAIRKYLLKESDSNIEKIKQYNYKMYLLNILVKYAFYFGALYYLYQFFVSRNFFNGLLY